MSISKLTLKASGLTIKVWPEYDRNPNDDSIAVHIPSEMAEPLYLSPSEAKILGIALISMSKIDGN